MTEIAIRLNHGFTLSKLVVIEEEKKEFDPSITDPTFFTPIGSMVRKLNSQDKISQQLPDLYYDFKDGRDTGMTIPISRFKGADITEIAREVKETSEEITKAIVKESKRRQTEQLEKASGDGAKQTSNNSEVQATNGQA